MTENLHHIDKLFKETIEAHEEIPSPAVWGMIDKHLDKKYIIDYRKRYTNSIKLIIFLAVMLLGICIYDLLSIHVTKKIGNTIWKEEKNKVAGNDIFISLNNNRKNNREKNTQPGNNLISSVIKNHSNVDNTFHNTNTGVNEIKADHNSYSIFLTPTRKNNFIDSEKIIILPFYNSTTIQSNPSSNRTLLNPRNLLFTFISKNASAEIKKEENPRPSPFSITFFFSPEIASYHIQNDKASSMLEDENEIRKKENHDLSSTAGVLIGYNLNKRWTLQSGLTYSNTNILIHPKTIYAQPDNRGAIKYLYNTSSGYGFVLPSYSNSPSIGDSLYALTSTHTLQYLGIPAIVKYNTGKGKLKYNVSMGLGANILIKGSIETSVEDGAHNEIETINSIHGLKSIYFSGLAGAGVEYDLNKKITLTFNPTARFALNSINMNASVKSYPNSFGFATGVKIKL